MNEVLMIFLLQAFSSLLLLLGILLCGMAGSFSGPTEAKKIAGTGILATILGAFGLLWPPLVLIYVVLFVVGLLCFACIGVFRAFKT
jgi:hypothetical protein